MAERTELEERAHSSGNSVRTWATVRTRFEGIHRWGGAPEEVAFLRNAHRHEFHVEVQVQQFHDDRDVEYIMLKQSVDDFIHAAHGSEYQPYDLGQKSCEMIAKELIKYLMDTIPEGENRAYRAKVFEDGENGAVVEVE